MSFSNNFFRQAFLWHIHGHQAPDRVRVTIVFEMILVMISGVHQYCLALQRSKHQYQQKTLCRCLLKLRILTHQCRRLLGVRMERLLHWVRVTI